MPNDNLVVIAVMARKGGSGKTTLSRALISAAVAAGRRVLLIDADSTCVLGSWHKRAEAAGLGSPLLRSTSVESVGAVDRRIEQVDTADTADFIFIDTAGVGAEWSDGKERIMTPEPRLTGKPIMRILCKKTDNLVDFLYQWNNGDLQPAWLVDALADVRYGPISDAA